jgi:hypothetical protein
MSTGGVLSKKRLLEQALLTRRVKQMDFQQQLGLLRMHGNIAKIQSALKLAAADTEKTGSNRLSDQTVSVALSLSKLQTRPKSLFYYSHHKIHKQTLLDRYPRAEVEQKPN